MKQEKDLSKSKLIFKHYSNEDFKLLEYILETKKTKEKKEKGIKTKKFYIISSILFIIP